MNTTTRYYAKVMLVGEYSAILKGDALTVPLTSFSTRLGTIDQAPDEQRAFKSLEYLRNLYQYMKSLPVNSFYGKAQIGDFEKMIRSGYYLESDIPLGYGIGSSGSVSAFIYDQLFEGKEKLTLQQMRKDLSTIESYFHGRSSGVDALSCYLGKPLLFSAGNAIEPIPFDPSRIPGGYRFFLVDSGIRLETGPLVRWFMDELRREEFRKVVENQYLSLNRKLIDALLERREADPAMILRAISDLQYKHFRRMIPDSMSDAWLNGQVTNTYYLKLNGSGGGYMLGIAHHTAIEQVEETLGKEKLVWI